MHRDDLGTYPRIDFLVEKALIPHFNVLLQQGVGVKTRTGCSVAAFLRQGLGADTAVIEKIQSVVLDGSPVDDIESALIRDGSVLALSAAMPGLVGATLRRGGAYASFRGTITYRETGEKSSGEEGLIWIKIFNLLMADLGPGLLSRGVLINSGPFPAFVTEQPPEFWNGCRSLMLDGRETTPEVLKEGVHLQGGKGVFLTVSAV